MSEEEIQTTPNSLAPVQEQPGSTPQKLDVYKAIKEAKELSRSIAAEHGWGALDDVNDKTYRELFVEGPVEQLLWEARKLTGAIQDPNDHLESLQIKTDVEEAVIKDAILANLVAAYSPVRPEEAFLLLDEIKHKDSKFEALVAFGAATGNERPIAQAREMAGTDYSKLVAIGERAKDAESLRLALEAASDQKYEMIFSSVSAPWYSEKYKHARNPGVFIKLASLGYKPALDSLKEFVIDGVDHRLGANTLLMEEQNLTIELLIQAGAFIEQQFEDGELETMTSANDDFVPEREAEERDARWREVVVSQGAGKTGMTKEGLDSITPIAAFNANEKIITFLDPYSYKRFSRMDNKGVDLVGIDVRESVAFRKSAAQFYVGEIKKYYGYVKQYEAVIASHQIDAIEPLISEINNDPDLYGRARDIRLLAVAKAVKNSVLQQSQEDEQEEPAQLAA